MRDEFLAEVNKGTDREKVGKKLGKKIIKGGMFSMQVALLANRGVQGGFAVMEAAAV